MNRSKKQKRNIFLIILGFFIVLINLVAFGLSAGFGAAKTKVGSDFTNSYNLKYEFDPYSKNDNPQDGYYGKNEVSLSEVKDKMHEISQAYSKILIDNGTPANNVYPEVYQDKDGYIKAFLNVTVPIDQTTKKGYPAGKEEDKINVAPATTYYNDIQSANFSILYCDGYELETEKKNSSNADLENTFNQAKLYMWDLTDLENGLVDDNNKFSLNSTSNEIQIRLKDGYTFGAKKTDEEKETDYQEGSIKDVFKKAKDNKSNETEKAKYPFMYIIHNLRGLINDLEYYINVVNLYDNHSTEDGGNAYNAYWQLTADQRKFGEDMLKNKDTYLVSQSNNFYSLGQYTFQTEECGFQPDSYNKLVPEKWNNNSNKLSTSNEDSKGFYIGDNNFNGSTIFRILQPANSTTHEPEPGKNTDINSNYSFLNKYVVGVVTKDNYTEYLPDKNPEKTDVDSEGEWLVIKPKNTSYYTARQLKDQMTTQRFSMPMMSVSHPGPDSQSYVPYTDGFSGINRIELNGVTGFTGCEVNVDANVAIVKNSLGKSVVQISEPAVTSIICLAVIVLIIGIIVSILYRVPGFILWVCQLTPIALIFLIMGLCGYPLSLGIVIAAMISFIASSVASILLLNKMKRNHLSHKTMDQAVNNAYLKSFFTTLDSFAVVLLLGIAPIFFPGTSIMVFGLALIIGALLGYVFTFFMSWLINYLIFNNNTGMYKNEWLSGVKTNLNQLINIQYKTIYEDKMARFQPLGFDNEGYVSKIKEPFKLTFNKWSNIITWAVIALITIVGLSLLFTIGIPQSTSFYGGTRLMLLETTYQFNGGTFSTDPNKVVDILKNQGLTGWYGGISDGLSHYFIIETTNSYGYDAIYNALLNARDQMSATDAAKFTAMLAEIRVGVQSIDPSISNDLSLNALYVMLIFMAFMLVYGLIRFNWMNIVPNLLVGAFTIATTMALATIIRLPIDTNVMYGLFMCSAVAYMTMYGLLGSMFPKWVRKLCPIYNDLTFLMNYGITVFNDNKILIYVICGAVFVPAIFFMPIATLPMMAIFVFGVIFGGILINHCWPLLMRVFVGIQNNHQNRIKRIQVGIDKVNLDKVDEELINGININTREIE